VDILQLQPPLVCLQSLLRLLLLGDGILSIDMGTYVNPLAGTGSHNDFLAEQRTHCVDSVVAYATLSDASTDGTLHIVGATRAL
jgi:hypothetical protein